MHYFGVFTLRGEDSIVHNYTDKIKYDAESNDQPVRLVSLSDVTNNDFRKAANVVIEANKELDEGSPEWSTLCIGYRKYDKDTDIVKDLGDGVSELHTTQDKMTFEPFNDLYLITRLSADTGMLNTYSTLLPYVFAKELALSVSSQNADSFIFLNNFNTVTLGLVDIDIQRERMFEVADFLLHPHMAIDPLPSDRYRSALPRFVRVTNDIVEAHERKQLDELRKRVQG